MKKIISMILALFVMVLPMVGCTKDDGKNASLTLSQNMINLSLYGKAEIIASYNEIDEITWSNDAPSVITMVEKGNYVEVTAIASGMATITVTGANKTAICMVVVGESDYALSVEIERFGDVEVKAGSSVYLPAKATYRGEPISGAKLTYKIVDETVATISEDGVISGVKGGETQLEIIAEYEGTRSAPKYVNIFVKSGPVLMLNATYFNLFEYDKTVGQSYYPSSAEFSAYIVDGSTVDKNVEVTIENVNDDVAIIEDGLVKSVGQGETTFTITCSYGDQTHVAYLYVYVQPIPTVEVTLNETDILLYADPVDVTTYTTMQTLSPTIRVNGKAVSGTVTWAVDAGNSAATVTNKGVVKSIAAGKAVISATYKYNGEMYKGTCNVTVIEDLFYGAFNTEHFEADMVYAYLSSTYPTLKIKDVDLTSTHDIDLLRVGVPNIDGETSKIFRLFIRATDVNDPTNWVEFIYSHYNNGSTLGVNGYAMNASTWDLKGLVGLGQKTDEVQKMNSASGFSSCTAGKIGTYYGDLPLKFRQAIGQNYARQMVGFSIVDDEINCNYLSSKDERISRAVFTKEQQATLLAEGSEYANPVWNGFTANGVTKVNLTIKAQFNGSNQISPIIIDTISGGLVNANSVTNMSLEKA